MQVSFVVSLSMLLMLTYSVQIQSDPIPRNPEGFTYIGSFMQKSSRVNDFDRNDYYASNNPASWNNAKRDCVNRLGSAALLQIESVEEGNQVHDMLWEQNEFASQFWTNGYFSNGDWRWEANLTLPSDIPWGVGYPKAGNSLLRVLWVSQDVDNWELQTMSMSAVQRYVCEVKREGCSA